MVLAQTLSGRTIAIFCLSAGTSSYTMAQFQLNSSSIAVPPLGGLHRWEQSWNSVPLYFHRAVAGGDRRERRGHAILRLSLKARRLLAASPQVLRFSLRRIDWLGSFSVFFIAHLIFSIVATLRHSFLNDQYSSGLGCLQRQNCVTELR
jgi:hypothetical protein